MPQFTVPGIAIIPVGHEIIQIDLKLNETTQEWESETTSEQRTLFEQLINLNFIDLSEFDSDEDGYSEQFAQDLGTPLPIAIHPESGEIYYATFGQNGQLRHIS